jgi:O-antigen ligase
LNLHPDIAQKEVESGAQGRQQVADLLGKVVYAALLGLMVLAALVYGGSDPWWKECLTAAIFAVAIFATLEILLSAEPKFPGLRLLIPLFVLALYSYLQTIRLSGAGGAAFGIDHPFWRAISADPYETRIFALQLLALTVLAGLLFHYVTSERRLRRLINVMIGIAVLSALFGLLRQTMQHQPGFLLPLLQPNQGYGQFINKNHFAYVMEAGLGLALGLLAAGGVRPQRVLIYVAALLPIWTALVLSYSRGGILAMLVQVVMTLLLFPLIVGDSQGLSGRAWTIIRSKAVRVLLVGGLAGAVVVGLFWVGGDRLVTSIEATRGEFSESVEAREGVTRRQIWNATLRMIGANPITGVGLGAYWAAIPTYHDAPGDWTPQQAHNDYLELVASGGFLGLGIGIWFVIAVLRKLRANLQAADRFRRAACFAALIAITGIAVHSLVDFGLHRMLNAMMFTALIVIATADIASEPRPFKQRA